MPSTFGSFSLHIEGSGMSILVKCLSIKTISKNKSLSIQIRYGKNGKNFQGGSITSFLKQWLKTIPNSFIYNSKNIPRPEDITKEEYDKYFKKLKRYVDKWTKGNPPEFETATNIEKQGCLLRGSIMDVILNNWDSFIIMSQEVGLCLNKEMNSAHVVIK